MSTACSSVDLQADLVLPAELLEAVEMQLQRLKVDGVRFAKVIMSLREVVEGDFFNEYIKKGRLNLLMGGANSAMVEAER